MIEDQLKGLTRSRVIANVREMNDEAHSLQEASDRLRVTANALKDANFDEEGARHLVQREAESLEDTAGRLDDEATAKFDIIQEIWELFALTHEEVYPDGN